MGINYENLISQIQRNLPTLPTVLSELSNIMKDPNCSSIAVEEVMASDQSMTMKILRVANTSFYRGSRERVTSTSEAIGSLGFEKIKNIALTTSVFEFFSNEKEKDKLLLEDLWKHSLGVGWASRKIEYSQNLMKVKYIMTHINLIISVVVIGGAQNQTTGSQFLCGLRTQLFLRKPSVKSRHNCCIYVTAFAIYIS